MSTDDYLDEVEQREQAATDEVDRLCTPGQRWRMRVPAREYEDSDTVLAASLADVPRLLAFAREVLALTDRHSQTDVTGERTWGDVPVAGILNSYDKHLGDTATTNGGNGE